MIKKTIFFLLLDSVCLSKREHSVSQPAVCYHYRPNKEVLTGVFLVFFDSVQQHIQISHHIKKQQK